MAALDRISCSAIPFVEVVVGEVGFEVDASWHTPVLQLHAATPYQARQNLRHARRPSGRPCRANSALPEVLETAGARIGKGSVALPDGLSR
jgi:hypothetical protein